MRFPSELTNSGAGWEVTALVAAVISFACLLGAPRDQIRPRACVATVLMIALNFSLMAGHGPSGICAWVALSLLPLWLVLPSFPLAPTLPAAVLTVSGLTLVALLAALLAMSYLPQYPTVGLGCILVALLVRLGAFPLHIWLPAVAESAPLPVLGWAGTAPVPIFLLARLTPWLAAPEVASLREWLIVLGVVGALYGGVVALAQMHIRRMLAYLTVGQAGSMLVAIAIATPDSAAGAVLASLGYSLAGSGLFLLSAAIESRTGSCRSDEMRGLASPAPHLAATFLVLGFASVGFPGSLGFVAEDVMLHGVLATHPWIGAALLLATAIHAIVMFRCFQRLFLGPLPTDRHLGAMPDLLPRERLVAVALAFLVIVSGTFPSWLVEYTHDSALRHTRANGGEHE